MVHPVMNLAPQREKVLILGGGDGCALREVLKYKDVKEVLLVDLDPEMTDLAATLPILTRINQDAFKDARVVTLKGNGISPGIHKRVYMDANRKTHSQPATTRKLADVRVLNVDADKYLSDVQGFFDIILVDLPDPSSPELTKLYATEFYKKVRRHLSQHGFMVVQATSPYMAKESYLCIGRTIENAGLSILPFHENVPSFGDWGWFIAFHPNMKKEKIMERIGTLTIDVPTRFITPEGFRSELVFGKGDLETADKRINTLLDPTLLSIYNHESWLLD